MSVEVRESERRGHFRLRRALSSRDHVNVRKCPALSRNVTNARRISQNEPNFGKPTDSYPWAWTEIGEMSGFAPKCPDAIANLQNEPTNGLPLVSNFDTMAYMQVPKGIRA